MRAQVGLETLGTPDIRKFHFLSSLSITCSIEEREVPEYSVVIELADGFEDGSRKLVVHSAGATKINLDHLDSVGGIDLMINSIRDRGWERLNYHVTDREEDAFEWYCRDVLLFVDT